jgi:hypothetical protein
MDIVNELERELKEQDPTRLELGARALVDRLALCLQAVTPHHQLECPDHVIL